MKNKSVYQFTAQELRDMAKWLDETGLKEVRINPDTDYISGVEHTTSLCGYGYGMTATNKTNDEMNIKTFKRTSNK